MRENTPVFEEYLFHIISTLIIYPIFIFGILLYIILYFQAWRVGHLLDELALEPLEELFHLPHPQFELPVLPLQCLGHLLLVGLLLLAVLPAPLGGDVVEVAHPAVLGLLHLVLGGHSRFGCFAAAGPAAVRVVRRRGGGGNGPGRHRLFARRTASAFGLGLPLLVVLLLLDRRGRPRPL